ncbi:general stress protein [Microbacterium sp. bgisy207]|uniref:general stress protein n=1 Tax=Microbacterium sp. bgisy207 TaxID=3413800 RepID=UPI003EBE65A5
MSMMGGQFARNLEDVGQTVATFSQYEAAQKAVSKLIAEDIPAREITIVGQGLRSMERVTGRLGYATAARSGAINGLLLGMLFSAVFVLGMPNVPVQAFVGVLFVGIAIGMIASLLTFAIVRRRRDFASVMQFVADHYDIAVAAGSAGKARQILGPQAAAPAAPRTQVVAPQVERRPASQEPPRYGQRIEDVTEPESPADTEPDAPAASALDGGDTPAAKEDREA